MTAHRKFEDSVYNRHLRFAFKSLCKNVTTCRYQVVRWVLSVRRALRSRSQRVTCRVLALCSLLESCAASGSGCPRCTWRGRRWTTILSTTRAVSLKISCPSGPVCRAARTDWTRRVPLPKASRSIASITAITFVRRSTAKRSFSASRDRRTPPSSHSLSRGSHSTRKCSRSGTTFCDRWQ